MNINKKQIQTWIFVTDFIYFLHKNEASNFEKGNLEKSLIINLIYEVKKTKSITDCRGFVLLWWSLVMIENLVMRIKLQRSSFWIWKKNFLQMICSKMQGNWNVFTVFRIFFEIITFCLEKNDDNINLCPHCALFSLRLVFW